MVTTIVVWPVLGLYLLINHHQATPTNTVLMPSWIPFYPEFFPIFFWFNARDVAAAGGDWRPRNISRLLAGECLRVVARRMVLSERDCDSSECKQLILLVEKDCPVFGIGGI